MPGDTFLWIGFSLSRRQVSSGNGLEGLGAFGGFDPPLQSVPTSWPHPCAALCYVYLQELEQGRVLPCLCTAHILSSHILGLSYGMLIPTILGFYYQQFLFVTTKSPWLAARLVGVWNIHISPLSSGIPQQGMWEHFSPSICKQG